MISAGANVQALFDTGLGQDTLLGNAATTLFVANGAGDSISSIADASTIIGGAGSDTLSAVGSVTAYLEGGNNLVQSERRSFGDLLGTGGNDTVNVVSGSDTVSVSYKATVALSGSGTTDQLNLATGSTVDISGNNISATIGGNNDTIVFTGSNEHVMLTGKGDTIIISGGTNDTITYSTPGKGGGKGHAHAATVIGSDGKGKGHGPHWRRSADRAPPRPSMAGARPLPISRASTACSPAPGIPTRWRARCMTRRAAVTCSSSTRKPTATIRSPPSQVQQDTISIAPCGPETDRGRPALKHATITGGGAHTTTMFAARQYQDHDRRRPGAGLGYQAPGLGRNGDIGPLTPKGPGFAAFFCCAPLYTGPYAEPP